MVAEESMRRQGYALEALQTFMCFITRELTQVCVPPSSTSLVVAVSLCTSPHNTPPPPWS
jgi:hypothetical protein